MNSKLDSAFLPTRKMVIMLFLMLFSVAASATPKIQTWQTANGIKVLFVSANETPMLDVRVVFDAGSARDDGLSGLAALTNGLLSEGAAGKTSQEIAEVFELTESHICQIHGEAISKLRSNLNKAMLR